MRFKPNARTLVLAFVIAAAPAMRAGAQSGAHSRGDHIRGAIRGAFVGAAVGAAAGYLLGMLGGGDPSCLPGATKCEGHNLSRPGARLGFIVGIPVGAIIGWRRA